MDIYELIANSKYFDKAWYLNEYEDVRNAGVDPIKHYIVNGWEEGRNPSAEFNNNAYLAKHKDAKDLNIAPLIHYEAKGKYERRSLSGVLNTIVKEKSNKDRNNKVIYTCISGDYIDLSEHRYQDLSWDYIAFTDNTKLLEKKVFGHWQIHSLPIVNEEDRRNARHIKISAHKYLEEYDYSLWVDANVDILSPTLFDRIKEIIASDAIIAISRHNERDCIYEEATICKMHAKDEAEIIDKQMQLLIADDYPVHNGLFNTASMFRKHNNPKCIALMNAWWDMLNNYSKRDQLSLCYIAWKQKIVIEDFFDIPTLEMYYDYIQAMQGYMHVSLNLKTNKQNFTIIENK